MAGEEKRLFAITWFAKTTQKPFFNYPERKSLIISTSSKNKVCLKETCEFPLTFDLTRPRESNLAMDWTRANMLYSIIGNN